MPNEIFYIFIAIIIILLGWHIRTEIRFARILRGKDAKSLEDSIKNLGDEINDLKEFESEIEKYCTLVEKRLGRSIQSVETVRFNPFKGNGGGGNQSFAISFVNEKGDGLVLSSLHHRGGVSVFSKPLAGFKSQHELTEEEQASLDGAKAKLK